MTKTKRVRYAVVGQGSFAQQAILPAFRNARSNSELAALVSDTPRKLQALGRRYRVPHLARYDELEDLIANDLVDAVYIALPNHLHREFTVRAARAGAHVLCEKPMAVTEAQCEDMIHACAHARVRLMIAYRLHFERTNLEAIDMARRGRLGRLRYFTSSFSYQVKARNIRTNPRALGGGALYDLGVYCINAARYLFRAEPIEVTAIAASGEDRRFARVEEQIAAILRFPDERLAQFVCAYGAASAGYYEIVGAKGRLRLDPAYEYAEGLRQILTLDERTTERRFKMRDQIAPEIEYFSDCVLTDHQPEPSGVEGLADVRVIRAIYESADTGRAVHLGGFEKAERPSIKQARSRPATRPPDLVAAESPHE